MSEERLEQLFEEYSKSNYEIERACEHCCENCEFRCSSRMGNNYDEPLVVGCGYRLRGEEKECSTISDYLEERFSDWLQEEYEYGI